MLVRLAARPVVAGLPRLRPRSRHSRRWVPRQAPTFRNSGSGRRPDRLDGRQPSAISTPTARRTWPSRIASPRSIGGASFTIEFAVSGPSRKPSRSNPSRTRSRSGSPTLTTTTTWTSSSAAHCRARSSASGSTTAAAISSPRAVAPFARRGRQTESRGGTRRTPRVPPRLPDSRRDDARACLHAVRWTAAIQRRSSISVQPNRASACASRRPHLPRSAPSRSALLLVSPAIRSSRLQPVGCVRLECGRYRASGRRSGADGVVCL